MNGADGYRVERRTGASGEWTTVDDVVTGTAITVRGLDSGTAYEFRVRSRGDGTRVPGGLRRAPRIAFRSLPPPPSHLTCRGPPQCRKGVRATYTVSVSGGEATGQPDGDLRDYRGDGHGRSGLPVGGRVGKRDHTGRFRLRDLHPSHHRRRPVRGR